jgi:hypothetical protein
LRIIAPPIQPKKRGLQNGQKNNNREKALKVAENGPEMPIWAILRFSSPKSGHKFTKCSDLLNHHLKKEVIFCLLPL